MNTWKKRGWIRSRFAGFAAVLVFLGTAMTGNARRAKKMDRETKTALEAFGDVNPQLAGTLKNLLLQDRQLKMTIANLQKLKTHIHNLQASEDPRVQKKNKRLLPRLEKKLTVYQKRLARELARLSKPYQKQYDRLKKKEETYQKKADELEQKGRKNDVYLKRIDDLQPEITQIETVLKAIKLIEQLTVNPELEAVAGKTAPAGKADKPVAGKAGEKRIPW